VYQIKDIIEKPSLEMAPSNIGAMGRYVLNPDIFGILEQTKPGRKGEIQLTDAIRESDQMLGVVARNIRYDIGDKNGWIKSNLELLIKDERYSTLIFNTFQKLK